MRVGIVVSKWNERVTSSLYEGAMQTLLNSGIEKKNIEVVKVPGAFEIPLAAQRLAVKGLDGLICLGAVIKGETTHDQYIASEATRGIGEVSLKYSIPIGFGLLTTQNLEQALARAGGKKGNKGVEAAQAMLEMVER